MITAPANWNAWWGDSLASVELRVDLAGQTYLGDELDGETFDIEHALFDAASVGNAQAACFRVGIFTSTPPTLPDTIIPITPYVRLKKGSTATSWVKQGEFFVDVADFADDDILVITAYDALALAEQDYYNEGTGPEVTSAAAVAAICTRLGVALDPRSAPIATATINADYKTCRDVLSSIAAASGGNWTMTKDGKLRLVELAGVGTSVATVTATETRTSWYQDEAESIAYQVALTDDQSKTHYGVPTGTVGNYDPKAWTITGPCAFANGDVAAAVQAQLCPLAYPATSAEGVFISPLIELGDTVTLYGQLCRVDSYALDYDQGCWGSIAMPAANGISGRLGFSHALKTSQASAPSNKTATRDTSARIDGLTNRVTALEQGGSTPTKPRLVQFEHAFTLSQRTRLTAITVWSAWHQAHALISNVVSRLATASGGTVQASDLVPVGAYVTGELTQSAPGDDAPYGPACNGYYLNQRWKVATYNSERAIAIQYITAGYSNSVYESGRTYCVDCLYVGDDANVLAWLDATGGTRTVSSSSTSTSTGEDVEPTI